ncbi:esterase/lipase family protein [Nocardia suismassiliense]|uniref:esterase/lipase family protein n=1 Tax=Nocardia suismassiliense TaxID=2077092 RepID=UPI000D1ED9E2|nr:alpha/beta fold hydrolase [Nocardia suismassiliense]
MKRKTSRRLSMAAALLGVCALLLGVAGAGANAAPPDASIEQRIADRIDASGPGAAIADYGFSAGLSGGFASETVGSGPVLPAWLAAFGYGLTHPDAAPPGANDWNCRPTAAHPRPVVLLHGTWMNAYNSFAFMSQPIRDAGFCTFAFNYGRADPTQGGGLPPLLPGVMGTGNIEISAKQLAAFVDRVLSATGAPAVDIIGYSQGGAMANWYTKFEGGAAKVQNLITYGATHHGSTIDGIAALGRAINNIGADIVGASSIVVGHAVAEQTIGSDFVNQLNANGDTVPGVDYTIVGTRYDEIMTPYNLTFLRPGRDASVQNITLQEGCEQDLSDHQTMMYSPRALSIALRALDPDGHPELVCTFNPWLIGGGGHL